MPKIMPERPPAIRAPEDLVASDHIASEQPDSHRPDIQGSLHTSAETTVGQRIRILRGSMTQRDFARVVEIHKSSLGRYERGEGFPDADDLRKLCQKLDVNPDRLLFWW